METLLNRNFKVKGIIECSYIPSSGVYTEHLEGIEVQVWCKVPMQAILLGKAFTDSNGEYILEFEMDSPVSYIDDGKIKDVFIKTYYNGEEINPISLDNDAAAYFDELTPQPSLTFKVAVNDLVKQLKEQNSWQYLDRLWIFATEYQQHATISLKNPTTGTLTEISSPTWTTGLGYNGNGSSQYLDTNFAPATGGQYALNNASFGIYSRTNSNSGTPVDIGVYTGTYANSIQARTSNVLQPRINCASSGSIANTDSRGLFSVTRSSSTLFSAYKNGVLQADVSNTSTALATNKFFIMANCSNGTASNWSTRQYSLAFIGTGNIDQTKLYLVLQAFANTLGFNV
ncbi:MAG: hypothetical protein H0W73_15260 [Bacteroidetes bacterium]|nr:hypothetical protein [Bacteroidota bacterium]